MSLIIFDKDNTIARSKSGQKFINEVDDQELIPGVKEKCEELIAQGHTLAIASNQGGVAFDFMTYQAASDIVRHSAELIGADHWEFCPHHPNGTVFDYAVDSRDRKPGPGMLEKVSFFFSIEDVTFVGDRPEDKQAAKRFGCKFRWAWEYFGRDEPPDYTSQCPAQTTGRIPG